MQQLVEFNTIQSLVTLLEVQVESYTRKEFAQFPKVKDLTTATLITVLNEILATPAAQQSLAPKGVFWNTFDTVKQWTVTTPKYHRLPQLLYFAEKAKELSDLIKKLLEFAQGNPISFTADTQQNVLATANRLSASLEELLKTTKTLTDTYYNAPVTATVNQQPRELKGLKGGWGDSDLSHALTEVILDRYANNVEELKKHISLQRTRLFVNKSIDKADTLDAMTTTTYAVLQKQLPAVENNALHSAILTNDLGEVGKCIKFFDVNEPNKLGLSPLYLAIFDHHTPYKLRDDLNVAIVKLLLDMNANPNEQFGQRCQCSFLHAAIFQRTSNKKHPYEIRGQKKMNMELIQLLVSHGASLESVPADEPQYDPNKAQPNIPGIIADKHNHTAVALLLRSTKQPQPAQRAIEQRDLPAALLMK